MLLSLELQIDLMGQKRYIPLRDRLILNFVFFGVAIIILIGSFSYYTARKVLLDRIFDQLTSVKVVKKRQIESFFADRSRDIKFIAESEDIKELLNILGKKTDKTIEAANDINRVYNRNLSKYLNTQNYYSSFYIISDNEKVLKVNISNNNSDKNLEIAPYNNPIMQELFTSVIQEESIVIIDLDKNKPVTGLFMGAPTITKNRISGVIALEISLHAINKIMYENNPYEGLGESGESYLVGNDLLMRSNSRFQDNSILKTKVETPSVRYALQGIDSIAIINDYRGIRVLSSFSQVDIFDLHWAILAEIDVKEALVPLDAIRNNIILISSFIVLMLFIAAVFLADRITSPLTKLIKATKQIGKGDFKTSLTVEAKNEIGDLIRSFNYMASSLDEKTSELKTERLKRLRSVIDGQDFERQRLSRELHDGLGQRLIALKLAFESIKFDEEASNIIEDINVSFDQTIDEIRRMSNNLMPAVLYEFGIVTAIRNLVEDVSEKCKVKGTFITHGEIEKMAKNTKTYLYRIAQEAVNNAIKHAKPGEIVVELQLTDTIVKLSITDDGKGFDPEEESIKAGNGLHNMRERASLMNGELTIESVIGSGTKVTVQIPAV